VASYCVDGNGPLSFVKGGKDLDLKKGSTLRSYIKQILQLLRIAVRCDIVSTVQCTSQIPESKVIRKLFGSKRNAPYNGELKCKGMIWYYEGSEVKERSNGRKRRKVKVKSLCLTKHRAMKTYRVVEV